MPSIVKLLLLSGIFYVALGIVAFTHKSVSAIDLNEEIRDIGNVCPTDNLVPRGQQYEAGGIILTAFDSSSMWVYNIDSNRRYPLPETRPCGTNCRLSPDARWITYVDSTTDVYAKMRLDGTERTPLVDYAADVEWWPSDMLLIWTPTKDAYIRQENGNSREYLNAKGVTTIQPGGHWGLVVEQQSDIFNRVLVNLNTRSAESHIGGRIELGEDTAYYDVSAWSPDGHWLAYAASITDDNNLISSEIYGVRPIADSQPERWTDLTSTYGSIRINGLASGDLSWSPNSAFIAFWVIPMTGTNPETDATTATLHILNISTHELRRYCGFTTTEHTPNPPRLIWSPDSTQVALGGNVPGDDKGYLLMALNIETGVFTVLSEGIYPTLGGANPIAWGYAP